MTKHPPAPYDWSQRFFKSLFSDKFAAAREDTGLAASFHYRSSLATKKPRGRCLVTEAKPKAKRVTEICEVEVPVDHKFDTARELTVHASSGQLIISGNLANSSSASTSDQDSNSSSETSSERHTITLPKNLNPDSLVYSVVDGTLIAEFEVVVKRRAKRKRPYEKQI